jgi:cytochrome c peroxidase
MAGNFFNILLRLAGDTSYHRLSRIVFGTPVLTEENIKKALAQFTGNITSANSKYDKVKNGIASFTAAETNGYTIFQNKCATCHPEPLFTDYSYRNIGLPVDPLLNDYGKMLVTGKSEDSLKFRVPSLRNVVLTSNYFHDGRMNTLSQVLDHYMTGIQPGPTLDPLLVNKIPLTPTEKNDVISFLKTLSDSSVLSDPRYKK